MITILLTACAVAVLIVAAVLMRRRIRAHGSEHGRAEAAADYVAMFMVTMYTVLPCAVPDRAATTDRHGALSAGDRRANLTICRATNTAAARAEPPSRRPAR